MECDRERGNIMKEQSSRRELKWSRLDNTANLFPVIATERMTNVYRLSLTLEEKIDPVILAGTGQDPASV